MKFAYPRLFKFKFAVALLTPWLAQAAEQKLHDLDPAQIAWWTWGFILFFALIGWSISELDKLADVLVRDDKTRRDYIVGCLKVAQSAIASVAAGIGVYFAAKISPEYFGVSESMPEMLILLAVALAGYGGVGFLNWLATRIGVAPKAP